MGWGVHHTSTAGSEPRPCRCSCSSCFIFGFSVRVCHTRTCPGRASVRARPSYSQASGALSTDQVLQLPLHTERCLQGVKGRVVGEASVTLYPLSLCATRVPRSLGDRVAGDLLSSLAPCFPFSRVSKVASEFCRAPPGPNTHLVVLLLRVSPLLLLPGHPRVM